MSRSSETVCEKCPSRRHCADGAPPGSAGPAGARLVGLAAAHFLAPLAAAIVAAVVWEGSRWQAPAGLGAFAAALATVVAVGALARRRSNR